VSAASRAAAAAEVAPVTAWLPRVRERVGQALAACAWPELAEQVERHLAGALPLPLVLPLASCAAAGGQVEAAVDAAAACALVGLGVRWLDDLADRDRPGDLWAEVGEGRAANLAAGALALGMRIAADGRLPASVAACLAEQTLRIGAGQELDFAGGARTADACLQLVRLKTGAAFALLTRSGALAAGRAGVAAADALTAYGEHLGMLLQALDDLDGAFHPEGLGDLALGKPTLPVVYAMALDHPARDELRGIVGRGELAEHAGRAREILEAVDARGFLAWAALEERRLALEALAEVRPAPGLAARAGRRALERFADVLFCDLGVLVPPAAAA
jgi:geranylgeranyl pyrophosphate synthase